MWLQNHHHTDRLIHGHVSTSLVNSKNKSEHDPTTVLAAFGRFIYISLSYHKADSQVPLFVRSHTVPTNYATDTVQFKYLL